MEVDVETSATSQCPLDLRVISPPGRAEWPIALGGPSKLWNIGLELITPSGIRHLGFVPASDLAVFGRAVVDRRAYGAVQRALAANQSWTYADDL